MEAAQETHQANNQKDETDKHYSQFSFGERKKTHVVKPKGGHKPEWARAVLWFSIVVEECWQSSLFSRHTSSLCLCLHIWKHVKVKVCPCLIKVPVGPVSTGTPCLYSHSSHNSHGQIKRDTFILNTFSLELQIHLDSVSVGGWTNTDSCSYSEDLVLKKGCGNIFSNEYEMLLLLLTWISLFTLVIGFFGGWLVGLSAGSHINCRSRWRYWSRNYLSSRDRVSDIFSWLVSTSKDNLIWI